MNLMVYLSTMCNILCIALYLPCIKFHDITFSIPDDEIDIMRNPKVINSLSGNFLSTIQFKNVKRYDTWKECLNLIKSLTLEYKKNVSLNASLSGARKEFFFHSIENSLRKANWCCRLKNTCFVFDVPYVLLRDETCNFSSIFRYFPGKKKAWM